MRVTRQRHRADKRDLRDEETLCAAYREHADELHRFCLRYCRDPERARDHVQEVFLRAWRSAEQYDEQVASLRVWLFAIARNVLIDGSRRDKARPDLTLVGNDDLPVLERHRRAATPELEDQAMDTWVAEEGLRRLGPEHRVAIVETYLRGRPATEVAAELGVAVGTVRSRVFYGLKALRVAMDEMGVEL